MASTFRLSVCANIVLAGVVAVLLWRGQPATPSSNASPTYPVPIRPDEAEGVVARANRPRTAGGRLTAAAVAQLEQTGISRETLINVVLDDLNRRTSQRVLALQKKYAPRLVPEREMLELTRQSELDQIRELKEVFGEEGYRTWDKQQTLQALNRARVPGDELPMTDAEAEQAYRLQKEFDENNQAMQMAMEDGVADGADVSTLQAQAQQALDRKLEDLLGTQRFNELRGRIDPTTEVYRTFGDLNPTPDQAIAVVQINGDYRAREDALARQLNENPGDAANLSTELKALSDAREENLRQVFGAGAYDTMKRQNDPIYKTLQQYADAWELKAPEVQSVFETLNSFFDQAERTRNAAEMGETAGQHVNWREINSVIERARQKTEADLQSQIGANRLSRLMQNGMLNIR